MNIWNVKYIAGTTAIWLVSRYAKADMERQTDICVDHNSNNQHISPYYDDEDICLHHGNASEHSITLKRYNRADGLSALQMAEDNHNAFRRGKISFARRSEGSFGSIGYSGSHVSQNALKLMRRSNPKSLSMLSRSEYGKYIPIKETKDSLYIGEIMIGTPPQIVHPIFDTGSTNLWVVGYDCKDPSCLKVARYNTSVSSTFERLKNPVRIHVKFGTGEIEGYPALDTVTIGETVVPKQALAVVDSENSGTQISNIFNKINFEGIVGLAFPEMSSIPGMPIFDHMALLRNMKHKEFAFYISNNDKDSKLMLGGVDPQYYTGKIKMFPVVREHYWEVKLDALYVGDEKLCCDGESSYLIFDSGTSLNTVPSSYFDRFISHFKIKTCDDYEVYPTITYVIGGEHIKLEPHQYMLSSNGRCLPAYMQLDVPSEFGNAFIVGSNAFMRHYLTVYHRGSNGSKSMVRDA
uniref:Aspartyl protease, putative n=1 Tax=Babesia bovis TaxID=5865 RepID=A7ARH4_BABBO|eukprot:XP_001610711.1 aspartyl protease [Babesia bovis T2Bo]